MLRLARENLKVILVAMVTAMLTAGAPAIAHGVQHALFAHNAGRVDGIDSSALQKKCKNGSVLAFARIVPGSLSSDSLSSAGITEAYNCASPNNPARAASGSAGHSYVRFPGLMSGNFAQLEYVVSGNVEGQLHNISFNRNGYGSGSVPVIETSTMRIDTSTFTDVSYSVTLFKVDR